ncbi:MAG: hypothetical protein HYX96_01275 [Chloroflexi bacterium]|nr:hypothetical protein [Chloroflexota bacterium]
MTLLRLALERGRWDLAAYAIVLATVRTLNKGDRPDAAKKSQSKETPQR